MDLNLCLPNQSHASEDTICNSTDNLSHAGEDTICISNCVNQFLPCQEGHKLYVNLCLLNISHERPGHTMYLNVCWSNPSLASENTKCISIWVDQIASYASGDTKWISKCVDQTHAMLASTKIASQYLYILNPSNASEWINCKSTYVDQAYPMPARTKNCISICVDQNFTMLEERKSVV